MNTQDIQRCKDFVESSGKCHMVSFPNIQLTMAGVTRVYRGIGNKSDCYILFYENGNYEMGKVSEFCDHENLFSIVGCVQEAARSVK